MTYQILWPDGIFMTKHPKRQQQSSSSDEEQQQEAERRAKFVHELMIGNERPVVRYFFASMISKLN